jgi:hypothetical protein
MKRMEETEKIVWKTDWRVIKNKVKENEKRILINFIAAAGVLHFNEFFHRSICHTTTLLKK